MYSKKYCLYNLILIMKYIIKKKSYDGRGRNPKPRNIGYAPLLMIRKPNTLWGSSEKVNLWYDEMEALRLKYLDGMHIVEAADLMGIGKSLFANIVNKALEKLIEWLIFWKTIQIAQWEDTEGGFHEPIL